MQPFAPAWILIHRSTVFIFAFIAVQTAAAPNDSTALIQTHSRCLSITSGIETKLQRPISKPQPRITHLPLFAATRFLAGGKTLYGRLYSRPEQRSEDQKIGNLFLNYETGESWNADRYLAERPEEDLFPIYFGRDGRWSLWTFRPFFRRVTDAYRIYAVGPAIHPTSPRTLHQDELISARPNFVHSDNERFVASGDWKLGPPKIAQVNAWVLDLFAKKPKLRKYNLRIPQLSEIGEASVRTEAISNDGRTMVLNISFPRNEGHRGYIFALPKGEASELLEPIYEHSTYLQSANANSLITSGEAGISVIPIFGDRTPIILKNSGTALTQLLEEFLTAHSSDPLRGAIRKVRPLAGDLSKNGRWHSQLIEVDEVAETKRRPSAGADATRTRKIIARWNLSTPDADPSFFPWKDGNLASQETSYHMTKDGIILLAAATPERLTISVPDSHQKEISIQYRLRTRNEKMFRIYSLIFSNTGYHLAIVSSAGTFVVDFSEYISP